METGFPFLAFAKAEIFHKFSRSIAEPDWYWFVWSFLGEVKGSVPGIGGGARFFRFSKSDCGVC